MVEDEDKAAWLKHLKNLSDIELFMLRHQMLLAGEDVTAVEDELEMRYHRIFVDLEDTHDNKDSSN